MMGRLVIGLLALTITSASKAASVLPIERSAVVAAVKDGAGRNGDDFGLTLMRCADNGDNCRYDAQDGVELFVTTLGNSQAYQIETSWNNDRPSSSPQSPGRYKALCRAIVAAVRPRWTKTQVAKEAAKLTVLHAIKGDHLDVEDRQADVIFYGSRNTPRSPRLSN